MEQPGRVLRGRWITARRRGLLRANPTPHEFTLNVLAMLVPGIVFLASVPIAYLASPGAAQLSWLALVPINAVLGGLSTPFEGSDRAS